MYHLRRLRLAQRRFRRRTVKQQNTADYLAHIFQPVAIETLGPINPSACDFISEIGRRISTISGDGRETSFLYQRLSITIQRYNPVAFSGTFSSAVDHEA